MAGYSKRSLVDKLGIKSGHRVSIQNAPAGYDRTLGPLPAGAVPVDALRGPLDFIQVFATRRAELDEASPKLKGALAEAGMLWVSWPKGASKVPTDPSARPPRSAQGFDSELAPSHPRGQALNENVVREIALRHGLVDVKVCAVDEVWSGLKLVRRLKDRRT